MTTLATLRSDIQAYTARSDSAFVNAIPTFIRNAEARLRREVVHSSQEITTEITVSGRFYALPVNVVETRSLTTQGTCRMLDLVTPEVLREGRYWDASGTPRQFAIEGRRIYFAPAAPENTVLDHVYYAAFDPLTEDEQTNYLLSNAYDLYLNLALFEAYKFNQDEVKMMEFMAAYVDIRNGLMMQDNDYISRGSARRAFTSGWTP